MNIVPGGHVLEAGTASADNLKGPFALVRETISGAGFERAPTARLIIAARDTPCAAASFFMAWTCSLVS